MSDAFPCLTPRMCLLRAPAFWAQMAIFQLSSLETKTRPLWRFSALQDHKSLGSHLSPTMLSCSRQVEEALFCRVPLIGAGGPPAAGGAVRLRGHARAGA